MMSLERFAERLKELMGDNSDTIYTLGEAMHLSPSTISRYINARIEPKRSTIEALSRHYSVNPAWLIGKSVDKYIDGVKGRRIVPILGVIAAGAPVLAQENIERYEYIEAATDADFGLIVKGDSMINARIHDGDVVFIRIQPDVENGEIAAVIIDGENATLKRLYKNGTSIILHPENPKYSDTFITKKDYRSMRVIGKCVAVRFHLE